MTTETAAPKKTFGPAYRAYVLFILVVVYTFNFIDRQILGILKEPMKAELGLTDTQLGILGGLPFAIFYATMGIPIAWLADRSSRKIIMSAALTIWSGFTAVCGLMTSFWGLLFARMGVGAGEAGGVAPAYSLIADYFPPEKRARAMAIYAFGIPIGSAIGIVMGGVLLEVTTWRMAFIIVGLLGVLIAPIFLFTVKEPVRGGFDKDQTDQKPAGFFEVLSYISGKPTFWIMSLGAASSSMMGYGLIYWLPSFFRRSFGEMLPTFFAWLPDFLVPAEPGAMFYPSYFYGAILLLGGVAGIWLGGFVSDVFGKKNKGAYALVPAIAFALTIPFFLLGVLSQDLRIVFVAFLFIQSLSLMWLGPITSAFQHIVPANMRATASAIFLMINSLIGISLGSFIIGGVSDILKAEYGDEALRYSLLGGTVFYAIAAILLYISSRRLGKDWVE